MNGVESGLLRRRLGHDHGFSTAQFSYHTTSEDLQTNLQRLVDFLDAIDAQTLHLVGHSLGGILALYAEQQRAVTLPGRIVCLGSPLRGSRSAHALLKWPGGHRWVGKTIREAVIDSGLSDYEGEREIGVIAGTVSLGVGRLLTDLEEPNDGTVEVRETRLPGITKHLALPVSHTGLLLSESVATQTAFFLRHGRFDSA
jgi:pimeloyl-ACP methyl ester carboxylesterase